MGGLSARRLSGRAVTWVAAVAVVLSVLAVAVGLLRAHSATATLGARTTSIAQGLKCPTCEALSVAESDSPMAMSMRAEIRHQLVEGHSPDQIRSWFTARYGQQVLLTPGTHGADLLLWVLPVLALLGGVVAVFVLLRRRRTSAGPAHSGPSPPVGVSRRRLGIVAVSLVAVGVAVTFASWSTTNGTEASASTSGGTSATAKKMTADDWVSVGQSLERQQAYAAAAQAYRRALLERPGDAAVRTRLAFVLVRDDKPASAAALVAPLTAVGPRAQRAEATLVLGLAQWAEKSPDASGTLRGFLRLAPANPAAPQIRQLLRGRL